MSLLFSSGIYHLQEHIYLLFEQTDQTLPSNKLQLIFGEDKNFLII